MLKRAFEERQVQYSAGEEYIYYNFNIVNNSDTSVPCIFSETLNAPLLTNGKDYFISCIRFVLDGSSIPIFVFKDNSYYVSLTYGTDVYTEVVNYTAYEPMNGQQTVFSYASFLDMINQALHAAWTALNAAHAGIVAAPPYLTYDSATNLCSLLCGVDYDANSVGIYFNTILYGFFGNFFVYTYGESNTNHLDVKFVLNPDYGTPNTLGLLQFRQEYPSLFKWFDFTAIQFVSNTLGVKGEYLPVQNVSQDLSYNSAAGSAPNTSPILTDFQPYFGVSDPAGPRGYLYYTPSSQYRFINLTKDNITTMDLNIQLRSRTGGIVQYYVPPRQSVQVKIVFAKRSMMNPTGK
jgi:hypothetical protein